MTDNLKASTIGFVRLQPFQLRNILHNIFAKSILYRSNLYFCSPQMVAVAQLVRASDCGSEGRGFEPRWLPKLPLNSGSFLLSILTAFQLQSG